MFVLHIIYLSVDVQGASGSAFMGQIKTRDICQGIISIKLFSGTLGLSQL
jgi:hypothetical protein